MSAWAFSDPENTAAFTTRQVLERRSPILFVRHDSADGCWEFHAGATASVQEARVIALRDAVALDPSLAELADLPRGWTAVRTGPDQPWTRRRPGSEG